MKLEALLRSSVVAACAGLACALATADDESVSPGHDAGAATRLREGATLTDQPGSFQTIADRTVFVTEGGKRQLTVLENLALERIARVLRQSTTAPAWVVSGVVTEHQGNNYLLVERAATRRPETARDRAAENR